MNAILRMVYLCGILCLLGFINVFANEQGRTQTMCPNGTLTVNTRCYTFVQSELQWKDANEDCKHRKGWLIIIESVKEKEDLEGSLRKEYKAETKWWVSLKRNETTGENWRWLDNNPLNVKVTPFDTPNANRQGDMCGLLGVSSSNFKITPTRCSMKKWYICEFRNIDDEKGHIIESTTPQLASLGATIKDHVWVSSQLGENVGDIVGVGQNNGQKTSVSGGLYRGVMTVLSNGVLNTSPQVASSQEDSLAAQVPTTADAPLSPLVSSSQKENVKGARVSKNGTIPTKDLSHMTSTAYIVHPQSTRNFYHVRSTTDNYGNHQPGRWSTTLPESNPKANSSMETAPPSTESSWNTPETPQPTMVDWEKAYKHFKGCYIPGTGGSLRNTVVTALSLYPDDLTSCPRVPIGSIVWPEVKAGVNAEVNCSKGQGVATFQCGTNPVCWTGEPDITGCASKKLQAILKQAEMTVTGQSVTPPSIEETIKLSTALTEVSETETSSMEDILLTTRILASLTPGKGAYTFKDKTQVELIIQNIVTTGSNIVSVNKSAMWEEMSSDDKVRSASTLLVAIEKATVAMAQQFDRPTKIFKNDTNMEVEIQVVKMEQLAQETEHLVYNSGKSGNSFSVPIKTLQSLSEGGLAKAVFITHYGMSKILSGDSKNQTRKQRTHSYKSTANITGDPNSSINMSMSNDSSEFEKDPEPIIASHVLSASVGDNKIAVWQLPEPVSFTMKHIKEVEPKYIPLCSFWDLRLNPKVGFWSQQDCQVVQTNKSHTTCKCDHMTNFAILLDVHGMEMPKIHQSMLRLVTIIGCVISAVSLLASWITFQCFTSLQGERNSIHKNLALTLLIAEILFVSGIDQTSHQIACSVIAGFLHFFFLAAFTWMLIEGLHIIFMLVQVFDASRSRLPFYYLAGYGAPLVVVGVSCLFYYDGYGTDKYCWLTTDQYFIWAFAGPVALILLVNAAFLTYAMSTVCRHSDYVFNAKDKSNASGIRAWVQGALALEVLLGLTWTLGYFVINDDSLTLAYVFAILNSLQGLFIFIFHCLLNKKAQKEYRQVVHRVVRRSPSSVTTQSTLTKRTNHTNNSHELNHSPTNSHQKLNATNSHSLA